MGGLFYKNHNSYKAETVLGWPPPPNFSASRRRNATVRGVSVRRDEKGDRSATRVQAETLRNNKNFIGPGVFDFASWRITAHIYISAFRVERAEYITRLTRHGLGGRKLRLS